LGLAVHGRGGDEQPVGDGGVGLYGGRQLRETLPQRLERALVEGAVTDLVDDLGSQLGPRLAAGREGLAPPPVPQAAADPLPGRLERRRRRPRLSALGAVATPRRPGWCDARTRRRRRFELLLGHAHALPRSPPT